MEKIIAFDIYGTILATNDFENRLPPRLGYEKVFEKLKSKGYILVTTSDQSNENIKMSLKSSKFNINYFKNKIVYIIRLIIL